MSSLTKKSKPPGLALRALRERRGLSFRDVHNASLRIARELGNRAFEIPPSRLHDIESKNVSPTIYRMFTLARVYDRSIIKVLSFYGIPPL